MATDFSRVRSNPLLDYAGVQLKQGAVLLDADANELTAIADRRLRALAGDVLGRATVGANTPDAFRITLGTTSTGAQTLNIGAGRLYVDGLLAENHGKADPAGRLFDDLMGEERFTAPIPYESQPYLPNPPPLPRAGRHLVYLDVWNREVTHLENPGLVETAVGVETGSRLQTVWQVRVLDSEAATGTTCASPDAELAGWSDLIAPSTGRLTTGTYEVAAVTDPCELPPSGGYRGLENQLYRVEIHDPGQPGGTATFKWSRDNASVGSRVATCVSASELQLETLGRDEVLRINSGDWVEIIDDVREFAQIDGQMRMGEIRKATVVAGKDRHITLNAPLPADMLPGSFPDNTFPQQRNLRVRLWNQRGAVLSTAGNGATAVFQDLDDAASTGLIKVPATGTTLLLENGVTVSFDSVGQKGFRAGDYWVFAARTADASVEQLDKAAPRGIHHHYARLSLWDAGTNAEPSDCRNPWPPAGGDDCSCTQCVTPESHASGQLTIEAAIRRVQETGGTVCIKIGTYRVDSPIRITEASSVRIRGEGSRTVLLAAAGAFILDGCNSPTIENLMIVTSGKVPAIAVRSGFLVTLQGLSINVANDDAPASAIALTGIIFGITIRENLIVGPFGIRGLDPTAPDPLNFLGTLMLRIENNVLGCPRSAIDLSGMTMHAMGVTVSGNEVTGGRDVGINMLGVAAPGSAVRIENNTLSVNGTGIRCASNFAWIGNNRLTATVQGDRAPTGPGISLVTTELDRNGSDQAQVLANQVIGFPEAGILITAPVRDLICKLNIIEACGRGIFIQPTAQAGAVSIENNHLRDIGGAGLAAGGFIHGIDIRNTLAAITAGNTVQRTGVQALAGTSSVVAIAHFGVKRSRVSGNEISEIGPATALAGASLRGILVLGPHEDCEITDNHVARDPAGAPPDEANYTAVLVGEPGPLRPVIDVADFTVVHLTAARSLVLNGTHAFASEVAVDFTNAAAPLLRRSAAVTRGNVILARGGAPAVDLTTTLDIHFADNRCALTGTAPAVVLNTLVAAVSGNTVRSSGDLTMVITVDGDQATVLGNFTSREIRLNQQPLPAPWQPLNRRIA